MDKIKIGYHEFEIDREPNECPQCHRHIRAEYRGAFHAGEVYDGRIDAIFQCPSEDCNSIFIARYYHKRVADSNFWYLRETLPSSPAPPTLAQEIAELSPSFVLIYTQAKTALDLGLDQVGGMGYRKALEFLIKDWLIQDRPTEEAGIRSAFLGVCINNYVTDPSIKICAERAVWLGNDETHYERKYSEFEIETLQRLITLTINWIHSSLLTKKYEAEIARR